MKIGPLMVWSGRDLRRQPAQAVLVFLALSTLTALVAAVLFLHQSVAQTFDCLLDHSPAMVVRRVGQRRLAAPAGGAGVGCRGVCSGSRSSQSPNLGRRCGRW